MEQYTDDERVEDLKKWWQENGVSIIVGIALGIAAIFGWRYWISHRDAQAEQASLAYDAFIHAAEKPDLDQARQRGQGLLADFPHSTYTVLATLQLAKLAIDGGDQATAIQQLQWVIDHAKLAEFQDIARLRLARVLFAAGQSTEAERLLDQVNTVRLTAEREELRGNLALAGNDPAKARTAYAAALAAGSANPLLQIKLDTLAMPTADTVIAAPTPPPPEPITVTTPPPVATEAPVEVPTEIPATPEAPAEVAPAPEAIETPAATPEAVPADTVPTAPVEPAPTSPAPPPS